jgi:hypothetical protein
MRTKIIMAINLALILVLLAGSGAALADTSKSKTVTSTIAGIPTWSTKIMSLGGHSMTMYVTSKASSTIGKIGYTWWTTQLVCSSGSYSYYAYYNRIENAYYTNNSYFEQHGLIDTSYYYCPTGYTSTYGNLGNHMYVQGYATDYPRVDLYW